MRASHAGSLHPGRSSIALQRRRRAALRTLLAAMLANLVIAVAKFVAAGLSGSSAMLSEGIHSLLDTGNESLLLLGDRRSRKPPDDQHPFGHGREIYFWSLIVAIALFGLGGGASVYQGIVHIRSGEGPHSVMWSYAVLGVSLLAEGSSLFVTMREFRRRSAGIPFWLAFRQSKDPRLFIPLAEDVAALIGIFIAFLGVSLAHWLRTPVWDGVASVGIGVLLCMVAVLLAIETRGLLIGEQATEQVMHGIREVIRNDPAVSGIHHAVTLQLGPDEVLLNLGVRFRRDQSIEHAARAIRRLERRIRAADRRITHIFVEVEPSEPRSRRTGS